MTPTIEAAGLHKRFGRTVALDGLDLVAEPGEVLAVLGPNGAGKTTFVRMVATLLRPDAGELRVAGHDVRREAGAVRRVIGLAGQSAAVEPAMTGRENLELVARLFGQDAAHGQGQQRPGPRAAGAGGGGRPAGPDLLGRHAAQARPGGEPGRGAAAAAAGRAHHRAGPAQPHRALGRHRRPGRPGHRRPVDHPVPGRGRPPGQPDRDHRPRPGRRRRHPQRAEAAGGPQRHRGPRARPRRPADGWRPPWPASTTARPQVEEATRRVSVAVEAGTDRLRDALRSLDAAGVAVDDVSLRRPTLDEVFLALTGQALTQAPDNAAGHPAA